MHPLAEPRLGRRRGRASCAPARRHQHRDVEVGIGGDEVELGCRRPARPAGRPATTCAAVTSVRGAEVEAGAGAARWLASPRQGAGARGRRRRGVGQGRRGSAVVVDEPRTAGRPPAGPRAAAVRAGCSAASRFSAPPSSASPARIDRRPAVAGPVRAGVEAPAVAQRAGGDHAGRARAGRHRASAPALARAEASCHARPASASKRWVSTVSEPSRLQRRSPPSSGSGGPSSVERQRQRDAELRQEAEVPAVRATSSRKPSTSAAAWPLSGGPAEVARRPRPRAPSGCAAPRHRRGAADSRRPPPARSAAAAARRR